MSAAASIGPRVEWVTDPARLAVLAPAWDELVPGHGAAFARHAWFHAWWRWFGSGTLAVCVLHETAGLAGVFPLRRDRRGLTALANTETPSFRPLARDDAALARLSQAVVTGARHLHVPALPAGSTAHGALRATARTAGFLDITRWQYDAPLTEIAGDFDAYRAPRRGDWRELERRARKMQREHDVELALLERPADLEAELEAGLRLEAAGWKGREGTAILCSAPMAGFYRQIARDAHARDELRLSALRIDGRLAGWDLALVQGGRYHLLKTAYDEAARTLSPGLVLRRAVIARCFEDGLVAHEFLGIDMPWKRLFATSARPHVRYRAYRRDLAGHAAHAYRARLRPRAKRVMELRPPRDGR